MFTQTETNYFHQLVDRVFFDDVVHAMNAKTADEMDPIAYYKNNNDTTFEEFTNVTIFQDLLINTNFYIDIFPYRIEIENEGSDDLTLNTELFSTGSDEEFFQVGTVMDLTFMDEKLLRKFILLSLMTRERQDKES